MIGKVLVGIVLGLAVLMAIVGNLFVCVAVFTDRRLRKNSNFLLVSLAVSDILVGIGIMNPAIVNDLLDRWVFGAYFCRIWISSDIMLCTASILSLCAISVDRYMNIHDPLDHQRRMTRKKIAITIGAVWIISALVSILPLLLGSMEFSSDAAFCFLDLQPEFALLSSAVSFYIPCVIMVSFYIRIYMCARNQTKVMYTRQRLGSIHIQWEPEPKVVQRHRFSKATVTLGVIMGVFLVCWAPFFIMNPIIAYCPTCISKLLFQCVIWLGYINSSLNPIIYSIFNTDFHRAFIRIAGKTRFRDRSSTIDYSTRTPTRASGSLPFERRSISSQVKSHLRHNAVP